MNVTLGIFDLFTYMIPGALHLAFLGYLGVRLGLVDAAGVDGIPGVVLLIGLAIACYVLGSLTYVLGAVVDRATPGRWRRRWWEARRVFLDRVPAARSRAFVDADLALLLAAAETHDREVAVEISRLRASGLMVRNAAVPLGLSCAAALVELVVGPNRPLAAASAALFGLTVVGAAWQGLRVRYWADLKTMEICFWIPGIDDAVRPPPDAPA